MKLVKQSPRWMAATFFAVFVSTTGIQAQLIVGGSSADGSLKVRNAVDADSLIFEVDPAGTTVSVGSYTPASEADADFEIADYDDGDVGMIVDGSSALLQMGSATNVDDGDIHVYSGKGVRTFVMNGSNGRLTLGGVGSDGDLRIEGSSGSASFEVDGAFGDATQALSGEGLVKAWCRVGSSGALLGGHRCSATTYEGAGQFYSADFTALATDISARGVMITVNEYGGDQNCTGETLPSDLSKLRISCTNQVQFIVAIF